MSLLFFYRGEGALLLLAADAPFGTTISHLSCQTAGQWKHAYDCYSSFRYVSESGMTFTHIKLYNHNYKFWLVCQIWPPLFSSFFLKICINLNRIDFIHHVGTLPRIQRHFLPLLLTLQSASFCPSISLLAM